MFAVITQYQQMLKAINAAARLRVHLTFDHLNGKAFFRRRKATVRRLTKFEREGFCLARVSMLPYQEGLLTRPWQGQPVSWIAGKNVRGIIEEQSE